MKTKKMKTTILMVITLFTISCSKEDSSSSTDISTSGGTTINTTAKLDNMQN